MNSTLIQQIKFQVGLKKFPDVSKDTKEYTKLCKNIYLGISSCLEQNATEVVKAFLKAGYVCPVQFLTSDKSNLFKITEVVISAMREPRLLKNICFATEIENPLQKQLLRTIEKSLSPKVNCSYREIGGRGFIELNVAST